MAGPGLPVNVDSTYADSGTDASVKTHQQHHDSIHALVNKLDIAAPTSGIVYASAQYSVLGNGTDETTKIQNALNGTPAGGTCVFPTGTSLISATLTLPNYVSVKGVGGSQPFVGGSGTTWQATGSFNGDILKNVNVDAVDNWAHGNLIEGITFKARTSQAGGSGIRIILGEDAMIRDCTFVLFPDAGVRLCSFKPTQTLGAAIVSTSATTITLAGAAGPPASGQYLARIDDETLLVTGGQGTTTLTVTRGYQGTTAATHVNGATFGSQQRAAQAPSWLTNICAYGCTYGVWCDWASGGVTLFGMTGDNNNSHVAVTYPDNNANNGGRYLTLTIIGMKVESSTWNGGAASTSEDPIVLLNNANGAQVNIFGGSATSVTGDTGQKNVVKMTNGYNGVSSTVDGAVSIFGFSANDYMNLLTNTVTGETFPWYTGDDYPVFRNLAWFNYGGETRVRSAQSQPRSAMGAIAPAYPMVKRSVGPLIGSITTTAIANTTRPVTFGIDATLASALPPSGNYIIYVEQEPLRVTAGQGTASLTASAYDPGGGNTPIAHAIGKPVYFNPETWQITGRGTPVSVVSAPPGSEYTRTDNNPGIWVKASGYDASGWQRQGSVGSPALTSAAAGSNAGGSPPAPVSTGATDVRGKITFGTGTTPAAGNMVVVTFGIAYAAAPIVVLTSLNSATALLSPYITSITGSAFTIATSTAPAASQANTVYAANYSVVE